MSSALWTRQTVRSHIKISFGVEIPVRTIGEYLKR
ncbi:winged helix-turn-helix domain-containing protein [Victivallis vadensis]